MYVNPHRSLDESRRLVADDSGKPGKVAVWLLIPYFAGDQGIRPLPSSVKFYLCESILINGAPYAGQLLPIGRPVDIRVRCTNLGSATTSALVLLWWADPTLAFTGPNLNFIGQSSLSLSTGNVKVSPVITWVPMPGTPDHACLLAEVKSPLDTSGTFAPATDRHYAQQNVSFVTGKPGQRVHARFNIGNTTITPSRCILIVRDILSADPALDRLVGRDAKRLKSEGLELRALDHKGGIAKGGELHLDLNAGEQVLVDLSIVIPQESGPRDAIVMEAVLFLDDGQRHLLGGLCVIVRVI